MGCFPTQAYLMDVAKLSNGAINYILKALEQKGLIKRQQQYNHVAKKQAPTRYELAFEVDKNLTPKIGDSPKADSNSDHDLTPIQAPTCLQPAGDITCKEPSKEPVRESRERASLSAFSEIWKPDEDDVRWARNQGFQDEDIESETAKLVLHDNGKRHGDLSKRWRVWMLKALEYRKRERDSATGKPRSYSGPADAIMEYERRMDAEEARRAASAGAILEQAACFGKSPEEQRAIIAELRAQRNARKGAGC